MSLRRHPLFILLGIALATAHPAAASLEDRKSLVVEGRTIDPEGFPIERVKVRLLGARRASVTSNADGQFSLKIPIGTLRDLQKSPLRVALEAERHGYRFAVPAGDARLGLELSLEAGGPDAARCVARSNDERVAASAARIVGLEGDAVGLVVVNFLGVKGEAQASDAWPRLGQTAQVALPFGLTGRVAALSREPSGIDTTGAASAKPRGSWSIVGDQKPRKTRRGDRGRSVPRTTAERLADAGAQAPPPTVIDTTRASARPSVMPTGRPSAEKPSEVPAGRAAGAGPPAGAVERPPSPRPGPAPSPPPSSGPVIIPTPPYSAGRARSRPLVIRNPPPAASRADSCECRVEGTMEVQTVVPIRGPQKIEVSLQWFPQLRDTVELFMGPPRPFKLPIAPCGPQRLRLRVLTDGHFEVASRAAMAGFRCDGGRLVQPRIVLVTR